MLRVTVSDGLDTATGTVSVVVHAATNARAINRTAIELFWQRIRGFIIIAVEFDQ